MTATLERERAAVRRLQADPVVFSEEVLGVSSLLAPQKNIMRTLWRDKRVAVCSAPSLGKTMPTACVVLAFIVMFPNSGVITTGPTWHHVEQILWKEIARRYQRARFPIGGRLTATKLDLGDRVAYGLNTNEPSAFGGKHPSRLLVAFDDAHGVPPEIHEITRDNLMAGTDCFWLQVGNPVPWAVRDFREAFRPGSGFTTLYMSALDHPNVIERREIIPGAISHLKVDRIREKFGEQSREWKTEVLGQWAEGAEDVLIPIAWLEAAAAKEPLTKEAAHMGVDVSRQGSDYCVATVTRDRRVVAQQAWQDPDAMKSVGVILNLMTENGVKDENVHIDCIGLGGPIVDRMHEQGFAVDAVNFAEAPAGDWLEVLGDTIKFKNRRSELHWVARHLIRTCDAQIDAKYRDTWRDLSAPWFKHDSAGRILIQPKDDLKTVIGCSPDYGDSYVLSLSRVNSASFVSWV